MPFSTACLLSFCSQSEGATTKALKNGFALPMSSSLHCVNSKLWYGGANVACVSSSRRPSALFFVLDCITTLRPVRWRSATNGWDCPSDTAACSQQNYFQNNGTKMRPTTSQLFSKHETLNSSKLHAAAAAAAGGAVPQSTSTQRVLLSWK